MPDPPSSEFNLHIDTTPGQKTTVSDTVAFGNEPPRLVAAIFDTPCNNPDGTKYPKNGGLVNEIDEFKVDTITAILTYVRKGMDMDISKLWASQKDAIQKWAKAPDDPDELWAQRFTETFFAMTYGGPGQAYFSDGVWDSYIHSRIQAKIRPLKGYKLTQKDNSQLAKNVTQLGTWDHPVVDTTAWPVVAYKDQPGPVAFVDNTDPAVPVISACQQLATFTAVTRGFSVEDDLNYAGFAASENTSQRAIFTGRPVPGTTPSGKGTFYTAGAPLANGSVIAGVPVVPVDPEKPKGGPDAASGSAAPASVPPPAAPAKKENIETLRTVDFSTDPKNLNPVIGPGTITTFNPHGFMTGVAKVWLFMFEWMDPPSNMRIRTAICKELQGNPNGTSVYMDKARPWVNPPNPFTPIHKPRKKGMTDDEYKAQKASEDREYQDNLLLWYSRRDLVPGTLPLSKGLQDPGSHINAILRVSNDSEPTKKRVQLFDTNNYFTAQVLDQQGGRGLAIRPVGGGIGDGCAYGADTILRATKLPRGDSPVTGVGVLPPADPAKLKACIDAMGKARQIGLCRLAITKRKHADPAAAGAKKKAAADNEVAPNRWDFKTRAEKGEVLYVSRLTRMYGNPAEQNYTLPKFLWSLKNTPYFSDIQVWWFFFVPTGLLAKSMWAMGSRVMTLRMFVDTVLVPNKKTIAKGEFADPFVNQTTLLVDKHYVLTHVMTNCGSEHPERAGQPFIWCRKKSALGDGGATTLKVDGNQPPGPVLDLLKSLQFDEEYCHPQIKGPVVAAPAAGGTPGSDPLDFFKYA